MYVQADLDLSWSHMPKGLFPAAMLILYIHSTELIHATWTHLSYILNGLVSNFRGLWLQFVISLLICFQISHYEMVSDILLYSVQTLYVMFSIHHNHLIAGQIFIDK